MNKREIWTAMKDMIHMMVYALVVIILMVLSIPAILFISAVDMLNELAKWLKPEEKEIQKEESY